MPAVNYDVTGSGGGGNSNEYGEQPPPDSSRTSASQVASGLRVSWVQSGAR